MCKDVKCTTTAEQLETIFIPLPPTLFSLENEIQMLRSSNLCWLQMQKNIQKTPTYLEKKLQIWHHPVSAAPIPPVQELQRHQLPLHPTDAPPTCPSRADLCPSLPRNRFSDCCVMSLRCGVAGREGEGLFYLVPMNLPCQSPETASCACCNPSAAFLHQSLLPAKQHRGAVQYFTLPGRRVVAELWAAGGFLSVFMVDVA